MIAAVGERVIVHAVVIPGVGFFGYSTLHYQNFAALVIVDLILSVGYEALRLGAVGAAVVGVKTAVPFGVAGYFLLPLWPVPPPRTVDVVVALVLFASTVAGVVTVAARAGRRRDITTGVGAQWRRPLYVGLLTQVAVMVDLFAVGAALLGSIHVNVVLAVCSAPFWVLACVLQDPPQRGRVERAALAVTDRLASLYVRGRAVTGRRRVAGGARP